MSWQQIHTAPRDGRPFLVKSGDCVMRAFYKKNTVRNAKQTETLQLFTFRNRYIAATGLMSPKLWMPDPPDTA